APSGRLAAKRGVRLLVLCLARTAAVDANVYQFCVLAVVFFVLALEDVGEVDRVDLSLVSGAFVIFERLACSPVDVLPVEEHDQSLSHRAPWVEKAPPCGKPDDGVDWS